MTLLIQTQDNTLLPLNILLHLLCDASVVGTNTFNQRTHTEF